MPDILYRTQGANKTMAGVIVCDAELRKLRETFGAPSPEEIIKESGVDFTKDPLLRNQSAPEATYLNQF